MVCAQPPEMPHFPTVGDTVVGGRLRSYHTTGSQGIPAPNKEDRMSNATASKPQQATVLKPVIVTQDDGSRRIQIISARVPQPRTLASVRRARTEKGLRAAAVRAFEDGHPVQDIARAAERPRSTVYTWLPREKSK